MESTNYAVGLDIGTTKIVAMVGRKNDYGKIEILGIGKSKSLGVHRGVVNNITQTIQSIQQAVQDAEASSGLLDLPMPIISILPYSFRCPIMATIFVVPMSNPTANCSCSMNYLFVATTWFPNFRSTLS